MSIVLFWAQDFVMFNITIEFYMKTAYLAHADMSVDEKVDHKTSRVCFQSKESENLLIGLQRARF